MIHVWLKEHSVSRRTYWVVQFGMREKYSMQYLLFSASYLSFPFSYLYICLEYNCYFISGNLNYRCNTNRNVWVKSHLTQRVNLLKCLLHPSRWRILQRHSSQRKSSCGESSQRHHSEYALASPRLPNPSNPILHILSLSNLAVALPHVSPDTRLFSKSKYYTCRSRSLTEGSNDKTNDGSENNIQQRQQ